MTTPTSAVDLREAALAKYTEAVALVAADGSVAAENNERYERLFAEGVALQDQWEKASGKTAIGNSIDERMDYLGGKGSPAGPFGGSLLPEAGDGRAPVRRLAGPSWADAIRKAGRVEGASGMRAELITPSGTAVVPLPLRRQIVADARIARFVHELIPEENAPGGRFGYLRQTAREHAAATVAPGGRKPTSVYTLERIDDRTRTIAHLSEPIPRQDIADAPALRQFVDDELRYGLFLELDNQVIIGAGAGEDMSGILDSGPQTQANTGDNLTTTRKAITKLEVVEIAPTAWVFNPTDWEAVELEAIDTFASNPSLGAPTDILARRLWSVPVLTSNAIEEGTALLGDFRESAVIFASDQVQIDWSENVYDASFDGGNGASDFERNMIRFRAEFRRNIGVLRPLAFVSVEIVTGS